MMMSTTAMKSILPKASSVLWRSGSETAVRGEHIAAQGVQRGDGALRLEGIDEVRRPPARMSQGVLPRCGVFAGDPVDRLCWNPSDVRGPFGGVVFHSLGDFIAAYHVLFDKLTISQLFGDNHVDHRQ